MMSAPSGRPDFFALEAGGYLQELGRTLEGDQAPGAAVLRPARALRGASLLAGPADFTRAAGALETALRAVVDGHLPWGPAAAELFRGAVERLQALLRNARAWTAEEAGAALQLAAELERHTREAGAPPPPPFGRRAADRSQPGVRAFLAREATLVAGAVERLARESGGIENPAAIENVLRTTRPLRGVAFLGEIPPLGELLDLSEQLLRELLVGRPPAPRAAEALSALAGALARAAREITEGQGPATDTDALAAAAALARHAAVDESDIVSIEALFSADDPTPVVQPGTPPAQATPGPDDALPMLALAGRLQQAADQFSREASGPLRHLQETALLLVLRAGLPPRPILPVDRLLAALVRALGRGAGSADAEGFLHALRQAAAAVSALADANPPAGAPSVPLVSGLFDTLPGERAAPEPAPVPAAAPLTTVPPAAAEEEPVVAIETLLWQEPATAAPAPDDEVDVVPIEALAPDAPVEPAPPPAVSAAAQERPPLDRFEASLHTYRQLLLSRPEPLLPAALAPRREAATAPVPGTPAGDDPDVVPIETLLYRGRSALRRADEVRREIDAIIAAFRAERRLEPLIQELLDLVPLALDESA